MCERARISLRAALWTVLGAWLGALLLFALAVAPAAFRSLPPREAGDLVGAVLGPLQLAGATAGVALALLAGRLRRGPGLIVLPAGLALLCLVSHFGITPAIQEARPPTVAEPGGPAAPERFAALHRASALLYLAVVLGLLGLALGHARADLRAEGRPQRPQNS